MPTDALVDEPRLVESAKTDPAAFVALYEHYFPKVYAFVCRRVRHRETAEDLVSQTFMKAFAALPNYSSAAGSSFGAWVYRIATNALTDHWRSQGRKPLTVDVDDFAEVIPKEGAATPADLAELSLEAGRLDVVLGELPERHRQVLELKFYAELDNGEIAATLGVTPAHAGVLVFRAVKAATKVYHHHYAVG
jgi:RNA polymerase sigma-70 factor (ECF subfamily)